MDNLSHAINDEVIPLPDTIGHSSGQKISVELGTRFLEHFSEQLYSSPQKAFEELISNGWDAGADCVDVRISTDLKAMTATMCVLDNGASMDAEGLRLLWRIAFSPKKNTPTQYGRPVIGQFGIGKLATYVLANKLTYICKASDGLIRRVTMNYDIEQFKDDAEDKLISDIELDIYEVEEQELEEALKNVFDGDVLLNLIRKGIPHPSETDLGDDEFGAPKTSLKAPAQGTWTLAVLSDLKPTGRELKIGVLRRMLQAALPFGSEMAIRLNGELLLSSKLALPTLKEWTIGPDLEISTVEVDESDRLNQTDNETSAEDENDSSFVTVIPIESGTSPVPHVKIPNVGMITGNVKLFVDKISGGRSDERGASNGFHINVLGRVVNQDDPSFGEKNLSHAAWARFRMTVRADGLNPLLTINREQFQDRRELKVFRAFLRKVFNRARTYYDSDQNAELPDSGDLLVKSLGVLSLSPLRNVVSEALTKQPSVRFLFDDSGIDDREASWKSWRENTADNIKNALTQVRYEKLDDDSFVKFRIADNTIVINKDHPFVAEHSRSKAEKELMRTIAMVDLLADVYALDIGVEPSTLENIREYRDKLMRFRAMQRRQSGTYIAKLLLQTQHDSTNSKRMEAVLSDALRYIGFQVRDLAKPGEPEGIASAYAYPTLTNPTKDDPSPPLYSFSFDAKSSKNEVSKTGNIKLDGVVEHRNRYKADHALVVAPGFEEGAITTRCEEQDVTPMTARDLGRLLEYTVEHGAIPLTKLREVFQLHNPTEVTTWVDDLEKWVKNQRHLTIDIFLKALEKLKGDVPDVLAASLIAYQCRTVFNAVTVRDDEVIAVAKGLSILVPDLVGVDSDKIVVNASPERVAAAVKAQLENLHNDPDKSTLG
ncbi:MAG TPA: ATP-binding protein [Pyrinomonadaceae bacterium]|jgi:hypothetical protein